jgi:hypothetical protein
MRAWAQSSSNRLGVCRSRRTLAASQIWAVPGAHTKLERGSWGTSRWIQIIAHWHIHFEWTTILPGMALLIPSSIPERWTEIHESAKALLEAIGLIIRQELERVRTSSSTSEEHRDIPGSKRALAVSKTEAAKDFGGQPQNDRLQHCSQGDKRIPPRVRRYLSQLIPHLLVQNVSSSAKMIALASASKHRWPKQCSCPCDTSCRDSEFYICRSSMV